MAVVDVVVDVVVEVVAEAAADVAAVVPELVVAGVVAGVVAVCGPGVVLVVDVVDVVVVGLRGDMALNLRRVGDFIPVRGARRPNV
ncbi:hypothetical protein [Caenimonas koreensis]|uniref:hypothetical protein n=1 Tax=Caenimonas koreensis TaxID=367474 RepID=UPI00188E5A5E|nr:hypothetical protein [Caenimonas koreensis]